MGRKPKYSPQTKRAVLDEVKAGSMIKDAAAKFGVSSDAAEKWVQEERRLNPTPQAASSATPNVTPGTVQQPKGGNSGGAPGGGGAGGANAAAKAAGVPGAAPSGATPQPPPPKKEEAVPKMSAAMGLAFLTQMGLRGYVQMTANRYEVDVDDEISEAAILTDQEVNEIAMLAPYMGGSFDFIMEKYGAYLGPAMFAFSFYMICSKRTMMIKRNSPILAEEREERRQAREEAKLKNQRVPGFQARRPAPPPPAPAARPAPVPAPAGQTMVPVADPTDPRGMPVQDVSMADLEKASKTFKELEKKNGLDPARQLVDNINDAMGKKAS